MSTRSISGESIPRIVMHFGNNWRLCALQFKAVIPGETNGTLHGDLWLNILHVDEDAIRRTLDDPSLELVAFQLKVLCLVLACRFRLNRPLEGLVRHHKF